MSLRIPGDRPVERVSARSPESAQMLDICRRMECSHVGIERGRYDILGEDSRPRGRRSVVVSP